MKLDKNSPRVVIICGPTCAGKTKFAIDVVSRLGGEIINADSMQVFRHMDVGTAKPTIKEQLLVFHHLIDIVDPDQCFDVKRYSELARTAIERVLARGRNVFIVGGTGLYIQVLVQGLFDEGPKNKIIRDRLKEEASLFGSEQLYQKLLKIDSLSAERIHKNDLFRIVRALEIFETTGKTMTDLHNEHKLKPRFYETLRIGVSWSRSDLYLRINKRVDKMINFGFLEEVRKLLSAGYLPSLKPMKSLGYRHIIEFLNGVYSWSDTLNMIKRDHRRYAKRQLTWFNSDQTIFWLKSRQVEKAVELIKGFLRL